MWKSIKWPHPKLALKTGSPIIQQYVMIWHSTDVFGNCLASYQEATPVSFTPKSCSCGKLQPSLPASIQDEITPEELHKAEVKSHKGSCSDAQANHLKRSLAYQVKKWKEWRRNSGVITEFTPSICTHHTHTHTHTQGKERNFQDFQLSLLAF